MKRKLLKITATFIVLPVLILFISNITISNSTKGKTFNNTTDIPKNKVGLVLGTSKKLSTGHPNPYYEYRITATVRLYQTKKIDFVLVSGDNGSQYYNEPTTFKKDLVKAGIPENKIYLDYAGFRTLDSMYRAKVVFGLENVTVISQKFHNERAIYLGKHKGLNAIGFNAKDVSGQNGLKVHIREYFARVKVFLDMFMNTQPKFFGDKIEIK
ncbi:vancomycin high temperature exclusion protein [Kriegella sp. EG-1]|nr:vancomycin high temperature exclusion protein [Flavobacteriaceae bacterium EG-1]